MEVEAGKPGRQQFLYRMPVLCISTKNGWKLLCEKMLIYVNVKFFYVIDNQPFTLY
jgi:hypothetical protein